jgi:hypothetical protein
VRRIRLLGLLLAATLSASSVEAATFLYLRGAAGDSIGGYAIQPRWFDESNATISGAQLFPGTLVFTVDVSPPADSWTVYWTTNFGGAFAPGTYEIPAFLQVTVNGITCSAYAGRVVVHEVTLDGSEVKSVSLDFEQHCDGATQGGLVGSLRYRAGDLGCAAAADGTSCDDRDACTPGESCLAGECVPDAARPMCPPDTSSCTIEAPCDPADGTCPLSPPAPWGESCDDGNACTLGGHCEDFTCVGENRDCDDASPCTTDSCDAAAGCIHTPLAEQCWAVASRSIARVQASGTIQGHHVRCTGKCASGALQVLLVDGNQYRIPTGSTLCSNGETFDGHDEVGTLVPQRHGRTAFRIANLDELRADLTYCTTARLKAVRRLVTLAGESFTGVEKVVTRLPERIPTRLTITSDLNALLYDPDALPAFPPFPGKGRRPPVCAGGIRIHCSVD